MIIRYVQGSEISSQLIVAQEKTAMPFPPSHVEALTPDGKFYLGSMFEGGVQKRPVGYDKGLIAIDPKTGKERDLLLTIDATPEQDAAFWTFLESKIGEPYDSAAIFGFIIPLHEHTLNHAICSALITLAMRICSKWPFPLAVPAHLIDPRDSLLMMSVITRVPM
jgi:hypothetical protein